MTLLHNLIYINSQSLKKVNSYLRYITPMLYFCFSFNFQFSSRFRVRKMFLRQQPLLKPASLALQFPVFLMAFPRQRRPEADLQFCRCCFLSRTNLALVLQLVLVLFFFFFHFFFLFSFSVFFSFFFFCCCSLFC